MVVRICVCIPIQLLSAMIYCGAQSDIRVKTLTRRNLPESSLLNSEYFNWFPTLCGDPKERLWSFLFAMGFIFQQQSSQYIIKTYRKWESKVMAFRICMGIPFLLSSAMIYYGPQSGIRVKTISYRNSPVSSLLNFECLDRLPNLFGDSSEKYGCLNL